MSQTPPQTNDDDKQKTGPQVPQPENIPDTEEKSALRRLLIILTIAVGFFIYSYGWTVTDVNLEKPLEEQRQDSVTRALRELLSPRIFDQPTEVVTEVAPFVVGCESADAPDQTSLEGDELALRLDVTCGDAGDEITVRVVNAEPLTQARLRWVPPEGQIRPLQLAGTEDESFVITSAGTYAATIEVPRIRGSEGVVSEIQLQNAVPSGAIQFSETSNQVIERMAETIFMALVATSIAIPIAALLSFFAARNLMREVRLTVGTMLMAFSTFVIGMWLGQLLLQPLGEIAVNIGAGNEFGATGPLLAFLIPGVILVALVAFMQAMGRQSSKTKRNGETTIDKLRAALTSVVSITAVVFLVGALGGLGILGGEQISALGDTLYIEDAEGIVGWLQNVPSGAVAAVGNLLTVLGTLIELFIGSIAGVAGGFMLAGIAANWFGSALRRMPQAPGHVIGAVLGAFSGGALMYAMALAGHWAALFGLLPPLVAGILGGALVSLLYRRFFEDDSSPARQRTRTQQTTGLIFFAIGGVAAFLFTFGLLNVRVSLISGLLPPDINAELFGIVLPVSGYALRAILVGAVLGGLGAGVAGVRAMFPLGMTLYNVSRTTLNTVRSIEPLIMGLVFVIWVGIGPFAGVLALTLHSIAALGKLYSEQIENIDPGPIEALQSTGANQLQTIIYAVVPQIIPPYIAFTMYRWDINVRMSTIIGFVGGGGIGLLLQQQINLLRYRDAGVAVLAIAVVVSILDYASASIRERLT
jgi:phosphonate ABC transporter permease subunit PhnE